MLKRDFSKSGVEYLSKNKIAIILLAAILLIGTILSIVVGMPTNFELAPHSEFSISINEEQRKNIQTYANSVKSILDSYEAKYDSYSIYDEGDNTKLVIRYLSPLSDSNQERVNNAVVEQLKVDASAVSGHVTVGKIARDMDYVYTIVAILLMVLIASIFAFARYNGASAMAIIIASLVSSWLYLSIFAILRLKIGMSIFALMIILNALIIYSSLMLFERMKNTNWLFNSNFDSAISDANKYNFKRNTFIAIALAVVGLVFILFVPSPLKLVSLNIIYLAVVMLFATLYVVPFVWSMCITHCKPRKAKPTKE